MDRVILALKRAYLTTRRAMDEGLAPYGMNVAKLEVLICLQGADGMEQRELQKRIGITSASMTSIVDSLKVQGLVQRRTNEDDARVREVHITPSARELLSQIQSNEEASFMETFFDGLAPAERRAFTHWLERVADNMTRR